MPNRFAKEVRRVVERAAEHEAPAAGSASVEAEHLLLALTEQPGPAAGLLAEHGLDHAGVSAALERETERSLAAVGVEPGDWAAAAAGGTRRAFRPRFGASAKAALERSLPVAVAHRGNRIGPEHLLVAVLRAERGRVPRALEAADVDRVALLGRAERLLD